MKKTQKFKKLIPLMIGSMLSPLVMAATPTTCPASLKPSEYLTSIPYGFDSEKQTVSFFTTAYLLDGEQAWVAIVYPIPVKQLENNDERVKAVMQELTPVSQTPYVWHPSHMDNEETVPYCIYTHPSIPKVTAVVFYDDDVPDGEDWGTIMKSPAKKAKHKRIMLAAKQFLR